MPAPAPPAGPSPDSSGSGAAAGIGVAVLMLLRCAGPALLAAGALAGIGAWLSNPRPPPDG